MGKQTGSRGSRVMQHSELLSYLQKISPRQQKRIINTLPKSALETFSEIALNCIKKRISLSPAQIAKLRPYENQIRQLALRKNSAKKKKDILMRGGFLGSIISALVPAILSTVIGAAT